MIEQRTETKAWQANFVFPMGHETLYTDTLCNIMWEIRLYLFTLVFWVFYIALVIGTICVSSKHYNNILTFYHMEVSEQTQTCTVPTIK